RPAAGARARRARRAGSPRRRRASSRGRGREPLAEEGQGIVDRALVAQREVGEARERRVGVAMGGERERVEAAALEIEELVAPHVADRAQLAPVSVPGAQQGGGGVAAPIGELG